MACVAITIAEAVVTTVSAKIIKSKENAVPANTENAAAEKIPFSRKLGWLSKMLWGGSALLVFEHVWHGEIVPFFPFLTAAADPEKTSVMLHEMASVGGTMALAVTGTWCAMLAIVSAFEKKELASHDLAPQGSEE